MGWISQLEVRGKWGRHVPKQTWRPTNNWTLTPLTSLQNTRGVDQTWRVLNRTFKKLIPITTSWSDRVLPGHIRKYYDWYYFHTTIKKSLEYPIVATTMSHTQCHSVESTALCSALQASCLPNRLQIDIVIAPIPLLGLKNGTLYEKKGENISLLLWTMAPARI